jgi:hypothetical protein
MKKSAQIIEMLKYAGTACLLLGLLLLGCEAVYSEPLPKIRFGAALLMLMGAAVITISRKE